MGSAAPAEMTESSPRPEHAQGSASPGVPDDELGARIWPILPETLALCGVQSLAGAQTLIDRYPAFFFFSSEYPMCYTPFANDFGPVNLAIVHAFYKHMHKYCSLPELATRQIIYYVPDNDVAITNAAFLLAGYLVIELSYTPEAAWAPFRAIPDVRAYRDVTEGPVDYELTVLSCLQGLAKAVSLGWYNPETFDAEEYTFLNTSSVLDMSMVSPKFCAFRGPRGTKLQEVLPGVYTCPPSEYVEPFKKRNVSTVVRLNEASTYERDDFVKAGLDHQDLYFDDCTTPPKELIDKFLKLAEEASGVVAVHCKAGLGRTGTLIAIYMMKHHGFTAVECIGWLRIVRPGSIIGPQQHFLHWAEGKYKRVDKVLRTGSLRRKQTADTKAKGQSSRPRSAEEPPPHLTKSPSELTKSPSELGEEIAKAQLRRAQILAKAEAERKASPPQAPARRAMASPKTPLQDPMPGTPESAPQPFPVMKGLPRPILRKRSSLSMGALSDHSSVATLRGSLGTPSPQGSAQEGRGRTVRTFFRSVANPFSSSGPFKNLNSSPGSSGIRVLEG